MWLLESHRQNIRNFRQVPFNYIFSEHPGSDHLWEINLACLFPLAPAEEQTEQLSTMCCELGSYLHDFKAISDKGFWLMEQILSLTVNRTLLGTWSSEGKNNLSRTKTLAIWRWWRKIKKKKKQKQEAGVKEKNWKERGELGNLGSLKRPLGIDCWLSCWCKYSEWDWRNGLVDSHYLLGSIIISD